MNLVFVSNFLNHHQIPLCRSFENKCDFFYFIATENVSNIGYQVASDASFLVRHYEEKEQKIAEKLIIEADAAIFGTCPNELIELRMKHNKLSFLYSERFFKKGRWRRFIPRTRKQVMKRVVKYKKDPMYVLAASAYLPKDLAFLGYPTQKCYKWGYFPEVKRYDNIEKIIELKQPASILWVARLIELKHPELPIKVARRLKAEGYTFTLDLIGSGELEQTVQQMIDEYRLSDCVHMLGSMKPEQVREYMERSQIFLFTSDRNEGWGAVLNEAMNSGCAVVANRAIGSVPYLINYGENGLIYDNKEELYQSVKALFDRPEQCMGLGKSAYQTMIEAWNADEAAERFFNIIGDIEEKGRSDRYLSGPCSQA